MARPLSIKLRNWLWRWLPIVFGCHCRPDRSFRFRDGAPFPICARCTGELAGILAALATYWIIHPSAGAAAALLLPMLADGFLQLWGLFGYALIVLLLTSLGWAFQWGFTFGTELLAP